MLELGFQNNRMPMAILTLITLLNISVVISFLTANINGTEFEFRGTGLYVLVGLELAGVIVAYLVSKRRNTTSHF